MYPILKLKKGKESSLMRRHPWVFSGALDKDIGLISENSLVEITDFKGNYLATGYVQHATIAVRILSFEKETINLDFWKKKLEKAYQNRQYHDLFNNKITNCCRLIHAEGDGLPGLIIDYYAGICVIQCHTSFMYSQINLISEALKIILKEKCVAIYNKSDETLFDKTSENNGWILSSSSNNVAIENGCKFYIDWEKGQKTGFFLDQRDNRKLLGNYSKNKTVLNTFAYTGGFSVYALLNGAKHVTSVDVSKKAIDILEKNISLNDIDSNKHSGLALDTFNYFKTYDELFDIVILDPPAFAKNLHSKHNAVKGYKRLNIEGLKKVKKGGLLFTFSCSQVVDEQLFYQTIMSAAIETQISAKVIHKLTQPPDHPTNIFHPEGKYLKGLVLQLD